MIFLYNLTTIFLLIIIIDPEGNYRGIHATVSGTITFHGEMEKSFIETIILVRSDE